jgi:hypothetical protein
MYPLMTQLTQVNGTQSNEAQSHGSTTLWLDDRDRIVEVCQTWNRFARANDGDGCLDHEIVNRNIREFIRGEATLMLLDTLIMQVRRLGKQLERPYRCDSPHMKRFMEMRIDRDGERVRFVHRVVRTEPVAVPVRFGFDRRGSMNRIVRCSMCNRVQVHCAWMEADDACASGYISGQQLVIYGVCPGCADAVRLAGRAA